MRWATELLCSKMGVVGFRAWHGQQRKLGLDCMNPSVRIEGFLCPVEQRRLCPQEIRVRSGLRLVVMASTPLLLLLPLNQLAKQLDLGGKNLREAGWRRWRWRGSTTTCVKTTWGASRWSHYLNYRSSASEIWFIWLPRCIAHRCNEIGLHKCWWSSLCSVRRYGKICNFRSAHQNSLKFWQKLNNFTCYNFGIQCKWWFRG
jgi:hypothetical protein